MRGLLVCVLTVVLMVSVKGSPTKEEIKSMIKIYGDKCLEEKKITLTEVRLFIYVCVIDLRAFDIEGPIQLPARICVCVRRIKNY
uniref:Uncharacterized protein n=1 Tax=Timema tahoe TaxID=61484 RepID=A0A7R9IJ75_9NEOP|nr:unnamed protein product [Timema tahoe]